MLLIDPGRNATSLTPDAVSVPWLPREFGGSAARVNAYLTQIISLDRLVPALVAEFARLGAPRVYASLPVLILTTAVRAIAAGSIEVAQVLPRRVVLFAQQGHSTRRHRSEAVRFARESVAIDFLTATAMDPSARDALDSIVVQPAAMAMGPPTDPAERLKWLAIQLMVRKLALFPRLGHDGDFELAWISHTAPIKIEGPAGAPPAAPSVIAQIVQAVENGLPDLPAEISTQAQTLLDAAQGGIPFCEECAKAAAGLLGV